MKTTDPGFLNTLATMLDASLDVYTDAAVRTKDEREAAQIQARTASTTPAAIFTERSAWGVAVKAEAKALRECKNAARELAKYLPTTLATADFATIADGPGLFDFLAASPPTAKMIHRVRALLEMIAASIGRLEDRDEAEGDTEGTRDSLSKEDKALATLIKHPEWTNKRIADTVGCNVAGMSRMKRFDKARKALKSGRRDVTPGEKDGGGNVEAFED